MSYEKEVRMVCDAPGCSIAMAFETSRVRDAREKAESLGWSCSQKADYCRDCAQMIDNE